MNSYFESQFPTPDQAAEYIRRLKSINLATIGVTELTALLDKYFPMPSFVDAHVPAGTIIYRGRICKTNKPHNLISEITMPPNPAKIFSRGCGIGEKGFFGASTLELAAFEVCQDHKNRPAYEFPIGHVTAGLWIVKEKLHLVSMRHSPPVHEVRPEMKIFNEQMLKNSKPGVISTNAEIVSETFLEFLSDEFSKIQIRSHHDYMITAIYTGKIMAMNSLIAPEYASEKFDGVMYAGVSSRYKGDNVFLFEDSFKNKVAQVPVAALFLMCGNLDFDKGTMAMGILHKNENFDGDKINWQSQIYTPPKK